LDSQSNADITKSFKKEYRYRAYDKKFIRSFGFVLPPFAYWSPAEFKANKHKSQAIIDANMGWDITDFGLGNFDKEGLFLFTVRNGNAADLAALAQIGMRRAVSGKALLEGRLSATEISSFLPNA